MADLICDDSALNLGRISKIFLSPSDNDVCLELWEEQDLLPWDDDLPENKTHIYLNQEALNKLILALQQYVK